MNPSMVKGRGNGDQRFIGKCPVMLETDGFADYTLLDSGDGAKLEQYGRYRIVRPEPQAMWQRRVDDGEWHAADAIFTGGKDDDSDGRWRFPKPIGESWEMRFRDAIFIGRFTAFRHVGVFPEQAPHWDWMAGRLDAAAQPMKVLNLFGYTGIASLIAAQSGAVVTHVDASKKAIAWARENQAASNASDLPIRWICDDAMKFVQREVRRKNSYDGIILDPPKFGRGPKGEVWDLFRDLPEMMRICRSLLSDSASFLALTAYSIRASFVSTHELAAESLDGLGGTLESGELLLREESGGRLLSTSLFSRWSAR